MSRSWQRAASLRSAHASASGGKWRVNAKWTASNSWAVRRSTIQHLEGGIAKGSRVKGSRVCQMGRSIGCDSWEETWAQQ
jgi:hypothetical protein